jgi:hypothetical protein
VARSDHVLLDDLALEQLDPLTLVQDTGRGDSVVLVDREPPSLVVDPIVALPAILFVTVTTYRVVSEASSCRHAASTPSHVYRSTA